MTKQLSEVVVFQVLHTKIVPAMVMAYRFEVIQSKARAWIPITAVKEGQAQQM